MPWEQRGGTLDDLEFLHARKTGALFRASLKLGALAARGGMSDPGLWANLDDYGRCFGLVFQITDDLLDVEGKVAMRDERRDQPARRDIECHMPGMIEPGRAGEPHLSGDLREELQRL